MNQFINAKAGMEQHLIDLLRLQNEENDAKPETTGPMKDATVYLEQLSKLMAEGLEKTRKEIESLKNIRTDTEEGGGRHTEARHDTRHTKDLRDHRDHRDNREE